MSSWWRPSSSQSPSLRRSGGGKTSGWPWPRLHLRLRHDVVARPRCGRGAPGRRRRGSRPCRAPGPRDRRTLRSNAPDGARLNGSWRTVRGPSRTTTRPLRTARVRLSPTLRTAPVVAPHVDDAFVVGSRPAADRPHRLVGLAEPQPLLRLEERVGLLVAKEPGLDLEVGALVVRERAAPVLALVVPAPGPDLLPRHVVVVGHVHHPGLRRRVVDAHERLAAAVSEAGHEARDVVARIAEVDTRRVHRPGVHVREVVGGRELHRVEDVRVALGADGGRRPPVEAVAHVAAVVERRRLLEERATGPQPELDAPRSSRRGGRCSRPRSTRCRRRGGRSPKSTGETVAQLCETGKLNSTPSATQAPR